MFFSRPLKIATFRCKKNGDLPPKLVVDFLSENTHTFRKIVEIVEHFDEKSYNNSGKPWNSSRFLHVKTKKTEKSSET